MTNKSFVYNQEWAGRYKVQNLYTYYFTNSLCHYNYTNNLCHYILIPWLILQYLFRYDLYHL